MKGTVPCFLFQLLVSRIQLISVWKKGQQNHEAVGLRIPVQEAERAESLQPESLSLDSVYNRIPWDAAAYTLRGSSHPFNSDTEPPSTS